jgi:hypothetical protein
MTDFAPILNWTLLHGSHDFPGPDGGTCINEAAIVASGFAYQRVGHANDLPACFCPVVGAFSVWLNDSITDTALRMKLLLPFVTRLAGTRGDMADEAARLDALRAALMAITPEKERRRRFKLRHYEHLLLGDWLGSFTVRRFTLRSARNVRELIRVAEFLRERLPAADVPAFYAAMAQALDSMLAVGPKAAPPEAERLVARMEAIKRDAVARSQHPASGVRA